MWTFAAALFFLASSVSAKRGGTHPRMEEILSWDCLSIRHNSCIKPCLKFQSHFENLHEEGTSKSQGEIHFEHDQACRFYGCESNFFTSLFHQITYLAD